MKFATPAKFLVLPAVVLLAVLAGCCSTSSNTGGDPCQGRRYEGKGMEPYADATLKFRVCIPKGLSKTGPAGTSDGRVVFSGFAVPAGTTLQSKTLTIVAGSYPDAQGATAFGQFTAGGVTFKRTRLDDGSAGHMTLHVVYTGTWNGKTVHFDFQHRAVNPAVYDPGQRPADYDQAAQIKLTETIMGTFTRLP